VRLETGPELATDVSKEHVLPHHRKKLDGDFGRHFHRHALDDGEIALHLLKEATVGMILFEDFGLGQDFNDG